jgi:hypothetical protein
VLHLLSGALVVAVACALPAVAQAAKWKHCPSSQTVRIYQSRLGAIATPFAHPGHEFTVMLSEHTVAAHGGFSVDPDGNTVTVTYESLFGDPITLPSIAVAAASPGTLYFTFPDARSILGQSLAGPVDVQVMTGSRLSAHIDSRHLVGLPPANDVAQIVSGAQAQGALATMDRRGAIWVPVRFSGFGASHMPMPGCESQYTQITAVNFGVTTRVKPDVIPGTTISYAPFRALDKVDLYLGDFVVDGNNYYGMKWGRLAVSRLPHGWGMRLCGVNDAVDLVIKARGYLRWARPWSNFSYWMPDSRPLEIDFAALAASDLPTAQATTDAFGAECLLH